MPSPFAFAPNTLKIVVQLWALGRRSLPQTTPRVSTKFSFGAVARALALSSERMRTTGASRKRKATRRSGSARGGLRLAFGGLRLAPATPCGGGFLRSDCSVLLCVLRIKPPPPTTLDNSAGVYFFWLFVIIAKRKRQVSRASGYAVATPPLTRRFFLLLTNYSQKK